MFIKDLDTKYASTQSESETKTKAEWLEEIKAEGYNELSDEVSRTVEEYFDDMIESKYLVRVE